MKVLQIASGDFFSTYGGGQVYVKNIVDEMRRDGRLIPAGRRGGAEGLPRGRPLRNGA